MGNEASKGAEGVRRKGDGGREGDGTSGVVEGELMTSAMAAPLAAGCEVQGGGSSESSGKGEEGGSGAAATGGATGGAAGGSGDVEIRASLTHTRLKDATEVPVTVDDFDLVKVVGKGSFGKVFLVQKKGGEDDGCTYAMKSLRKDVLVKRNQVEHTKTERAILESVNHPYIVCLRYAFQTRDKLYLVTDFAPGGELFFWLKRERVFSQARARLYAAELVLALEHLHSLDIVYRDLKPENILLDADGHIKLTDFGLSKMQVTGFGAEGGTKTFCGTPEYLAPEILNNEGHGKAVDWWSLGTLLYEMMAGLPPFYDTNTEVMYDKILHSELRFPRHFLPETRSLLAGMLTRQVERRLGFRGAAEIKAHPFFAGLDWDAVASRRIKPTFVPPPNGIEGAESVVSNFEDEFTKETPVDSVVERSKLSSTAVERTHFDGFTYMGDGGALAAAVSGVEGIEEDDAGGAGFDGDRRESFAEGSAMARPVGGDKHG